MLSPIKSITSNNGVENHHLDTLKLDWYVTNAYSSWQKRTIEQKHRQIHKFIPKRKSLDQLTQRDCDLIALIINCETYLQNRWYQLRKTITREGLDYFFNIDEKDMERIANLYK